MSSPFSSINWADIFRMEVGLGVTIVTKDGRVAYSNESARSLFGVTPAKLGTYRHLSAVFHPEFVRERMAWIEQVIEDGKPLRARHIYNGHQMVSTFYPISDGGELLRSMDATKQDDASVNANENQPAPIDESSAGDESNSDDESGGAQYVLILSRRDPLDSTEDIETVTSQYVDLGCLSALSNRELEIFILLGHGKSVPEVAKMLHRSPRTAERHKTEIGRKLGYSTLAEIARAVGHLGLTYDHLQLERFHALAKDAKGVEDETQE
tara:strand:+ start:10651 stop:11451 length:801 start_codon:yes stop_codon:yes gene_type:complete